MSDMINRQDAIVLAVNAARKADSKEARDILMDLRKDMWNLPSAEPKTGRWIEQDDGWGGTYYECSCCKEAFTLIDGTPSDNLYNYCPSCGARME